MIYTYHRKWLFESCTTFRSAIERTPKIYLSPRLRKFPKGSCGDASPILGFYLKHNRFGDFNYICGMIGMQSHAWLTQDKLILDITGDQFPGRPEVFVGEKDEFYAGYMQRIQTSHNFESSLTSILLDDYKIISMYL